MNWYKSSQYSSLMYHGSSGPDALLAKSNFPGVFLNPDPDIARNDGPNVYGYRVNPGRYFAPDILSPSKEDYRIAVGFGKKHGAKSGEDCRKMLQILLQNPTEDFVQYMSGLGYLGYIDYDRMFLFDPSSAQYVGKYNFEKKVVEK